MHSIYTALLDHAARTTPSTIVPIVSCGGLAYADRIPCESSDPLDILIAAEEGDEHGAYPTTHDVLRFYQAPAAIAAKGNEVK